MRIRVTRLLGGMLVLCAAAGCAGEGGAPRVPVVGQPVPAYEAAVLGGGGTQSLAGLRGSPVLLNVWATWCHPCREELPDLQALHQELGPRGLKVVGVSIDQEGMAEEIPGFLEEFGVTYPIWHDASDRVTSTFRTLGVPTTFLIGPDGTLLWQHVGPVRADDPKLRGLIEEALGAAAAG